MINLARRFSPIFLFLVSAVSLLAAVRASAESFDFERLVARAERSAKAPFEDRPKVPKWLIDLNYDKWRDIRFRTDKALWGDGKHRFTAQFFHPGLYYERSVRVHTIDTQGNVEPFTFEPELFDYGKNDFGDRVPKDLGFAGFRIHYPINKPEYRDEVVVFLGASYFRALGKDLVYGLSARGLAVDTVLPSGEEFPHFTEFWLVTPAPNAKTLTIYALLDSPRVTGAYRFDVGPGEETVVAVDSRVFLRKPVGKLGIAPLTSMFLHGENTVRHFRDYRPEVHDSDGVLMKFASGEWSWRPLDNPDQLETRAFQMPDPKGFGLLQRDRDFDHYQDLETRAEDRPSVWIVPKGDWGAGHLEIVEIPTKREIDDNIVTYWVPEKPAEPGVAMPFAYELHWYRDAPNRPPTGRAVATRRAAGEVKGAQRFIVDFEGKALRAMAPDTEVRGIVTVNGSTEIGEELVEQHVLKNVPTGGWRLSFQVRPKNEKPIELRAFLQRGDDVLTETWTYTFKP